MKAIYAGIVVASLGVGFIAGLASSPTAEIILPDNGRLNDTILDGAVIRSEGKFISISNNLIIMPGLEWKLRRLFGMKGTW